jgi:hypothetical protein
MSTGRFEQLRRFWKPHRNDDHPLTKQERAELRPDSAYDGLANAAGKYLGADLDPEGRRGTADWD